MKIISGNYSKKTFENLKKFVFSNYPTQPMIMSIISDYCLVSAEGKEHTSTSYHLLEISKKEGIRLRLLQDERSVGKWDKIDSMAVQGLDLEWIVLSTKEYIIKIFRSDLMDSDKQLIRLYDFPKE